MSNILKSTKVYLVGHMQYENGRGWREQITKDLVEMGITVFDPYHKPFIDDTNEDENVRAQLKKWMDQEEYDSVANRMKKVRAFDLRLCDLSDFIIAHINPKIASWGSAEELVTSCRMKKPTFISIEGGKTKTPLWMMGMFPHKYFYNSIEEIVQVLRRIDSGQKELDNERWKLLKEEYR
jgi:hypothetical protein